MPRPKKFGSKKRTTVEGNLQKARGVLKLLQKAKKNEGAKEKKMIISPMEPEEMAAVLVENLRVPNRSLEIPLGCHHILRIGSSQINRLVQDSLTYERTLQRTYYQGARADGNFWEKEFCAGKEVYWEGRNRVFTRGNNKPTLQSNLLPWVVATPDFVVEVRDRRGNMVKIVVEVKSTISEATYNSPPADYKAQIRTAMACFGICRGVLVVYLVDKDDRQELVAGPKTFGVRGKGYLEANFSIITKNYAKFLHETIEKFTGKSLDAAIMAKQICSIATTNLQNKERGGVEVTEREQYCYMCPQKYPKSNRKGRSASGVVTYRPALLGEPHRFK